jgi:hypothetical protein
VRGSKDRAKDASSNHAHDVRLTRAYALWRMLTTFPSSAPFGHPLSSVRRPSQGDTRDSPTDRPRLTFRRRPAKSAAFQKARMPFTVTDKKENLREGMAPSGLHSGTHAYAAHTCSQVWGQCLDWALQDHRCGHPQVPVMFESADAFVARWYFRAWD